MGPHPKDMTERDEQLIKAKKAMSKVSGGKNRQKQMQKRARWAIVIGALFIIFGALLGTLLVDPFFKNLIASFVYFGVIIVGCGLVVLLAFK